MAMPEVESNGSSSSCWFIIDGRVYDATQWPSSHPGGSGAITGKCGKDASAAFNGQGAHSSKKPKADHHNPKVPAVGVLLPPSTPAPTGAFPMAQVQAHGSRGDCWFVIAEVVYDATGPS